MPQTHADRITALARLIMEQPGQQRGPFPPQDLIDAVSMIPRLIEQDQAAERRDTKRALRLALPAAARPLVSMADELDTLARDAAAYAISPTRLAEQLRQLASETRRQLDDLAAETDAARYPTERDD